MTTLPNRATPAGMQQRVPGAAQVNAQAQAQNARPGQVGIGTAATTGVRKQLNGLNPAQRAAFTQWIAAHAAGGAQAPAAAAPAAGGAIPTSLGGVQSAQFDAAQDTANENYRTAIHGNEHQQNLTMNSYLPQYRDLATKQGLERTALPGSYQQRGLLGSGIYNSGLQQLDQQHLNQTTDLQGQEAGQISTLQNARNGIERSRAQALAGVHAQRLAALAKLAVGSIK